MILFGAPKSRRRFDLRHDWTRKPSALLQLRFGRFRRGFLLRRMVKDYRPVLRSDIRPLPIHSCRIVIGPENIKQFLIPDLGWIELDLHGFGVTSFICANIFVRRVLFRPAGVADGS